jgi:hypothetical protein
MNTNHLVQMHNTLSQIEDKALKLMIMIQTCESEDEITPTNTKDKRPVNRGLNDLNNNLNNYLTKKM